MVIVHLCALNDSNGNPRRAYLLLSQSGPQKIWDEGYDGGSAVPAEFSHLVAGAVRIDVSPTELKRWFKRLRAIETV